VEIWHRRLLSHATAADMELFQGGGGIQDLKALSALDRFGRKKAKNQINVLDCSIWTGRGRSLPVPSRSARPLRACKTINRKKNGRGCNNRRRAP
jgi:hypothetical protein